MRISRIRITIERLRTLVLVTGGLLIVALVAFLTIAHYRNKYNIKEILKPLGANIQREQNGVTYTQAISGRTKYKIHASKVVQLKSDGRVLLHDVAIDLYGEDGSSVVDRITGNDFEYDQKGGTAAAAGPVEIIILRPGVKPAVARGSSSNLLPGKGKNSPLASMAQTAASGQIDVKTSGLTLFIKTGVASTAQRVEFSALQGHGSSTGAAFDSGQGQLVLDRAVELNLRHGTENVLVHAQHAQLDRDDLTCLLTMAEAGYRGGVAGSGHAKLLFREDGSAVRMDATDGFTMTTATGTRLAAPAGSLDFNDHNQPREGHLEGGVSMASDANGRRVQGSAPTAQLAFTPQGTLRMVHLEHGVQLNLEEDQAGNVHVAREWRSPVADIDFRSTKSGQLQMAHVRGTGGVILTGQSQRPGGPVLRSRMTADQVIGDFGPQQELTQILGTGHAGIQQTTASGAHQTTSGDRLTAHFASSAKGPATGRQTMAEQIQSAAIDGNVVLTQEQPAKPGAAGEAAQPSMRATAGHATYEGAGEWVHLTVNPRIDDGALQLTANKVDVSQASGDAFASGDVKATWADAKGGSTAGQGIALGGQGPAHVVAAEAQLHKATDEATFKGHARLWQQANSVSAPVIVLDRSRQTLVARTTSAKDPVNVVMLSAGGQKSSSRPNSSRANSAPSVIRIQAGDLRYSGAERKVVLNAGQAGSVTADTGTGSTSSNEAEVFLLPPGNHAAADGGSAQVDRLTARGNVVVNSQGRRGTGEQLTYSSETGEYVLTGTAAAPPQLADPVRGTVTGDALIFNSRDDSVRVEGQGQKALTQTTAPK